MRHKRAHILIEHQILTAPRRDAEGAVPDHLGHLVCMHAGGIHNIAGKKRIMRRSDRKQIFPEHDSLRFAVAVKIDAVFYRILHCCNRQLIRADDCGGRRPKRPTRPLGYVRLHLMQPRLADDLQLRHMVMLTAL